MKELPQNYEAIATEKKWQKEWHKSGVYNWNEKVAREDSYVIDTPPPTVSGSLHMGHIYSYTQADFIARFQRMIGKNVFYPMGFDDNGLPTERLVEKTKKTKAHLHTREDFIKMCNEVAEGARKDFRNLFESIALSVDWNQEYYTISDESRRISQMSFLDLYKKNEVYRKLQPMFWDPIDQTAIAQAEIEEKELDSFENFIWFGLIDENADIKNTKWEDLQKVEIMTTRPELLAACVALVIHPDDAHKYKGKKAVTPLFNFIVPIIADDKVDKEKGTGVVMCCTFGDETDIFWQRKHSLEIRLFIDKHGKLRANQINTTEWPCLNPVKCIEFLKVIDGVKTDHQDKKLSAKMKSIELLEQNGLTAKEKKAIKHSVKCAERSGSPLELIPTNQWFVKVIDHKEALKKKADECIWRPEFMKHRIHQWIDGLSWDWCISRQRYFGVPFPVWFSKRAGEEGKIIVADINKLPVNPLVDLPEGYTRDEVTPEADVMDTWATSSVSPQLSSKAINKDFAVDYNRHQKLFPADLRPQAHEIIRTWAFYTIVKAYLHEDSIPWKNLMISGWCLAEDKSKMSKSKGNVVTPVEIIAENSADVVRYWASTSRLGADTAFSKDVLKIGRKLANKLWNATKFAAIFLPLIEKEPVSAADDIAKGIITEPLDIAVLSLLGQTVDKATNEFNNYEYSAARSAAEWFFWNFCDNYLEIVKKTYYDESIENQKRRQSVIHTIYHCLDGVLRLFAPFMPHVTEELYQAIFDKKLVALNINSIHSKGNWPNAKDYSINQDSIFTYGLACKIVSTAREEKTFAQVSLNKEINYLLISIEDKKLQELLKEKIESISKYLKDVTGAKNLLLSNAKEESLENSIGMTILEYSESSSLIEKWSNIKAEVA